MNGPLAQALSYRLKELHYPTDYQIQLLIHSSTKRKLWKRIS